MTIRAIYEKGVFKPLDPVHLPEKSEVQVVVPSTDTADGSLDSIYKILDESYPSGESDVPERHNEHQP